MPRYAVAGLALFFSTAICLGWLSATLIADGAIALSAGLPYGAWAYSTSHIIGIVIVTLAGIVASSFFLFSLWGGFLNTCGKILRGSTDVSILEFLRFSIMHSKELWAIGLLQLFIGALLSVPGVVASAFFLPLGMPFVLVAHFAAGALFSLCYVAVAEEGGVRKSLAGGFRAAFARPIAWIAMSIACFAIYGAGLLLGPLYVAYHFLVAAPLVAVIQIVYYQKTGK